MNNHPELKRLRFFTGFFTTARDWNEGQDYHIAKRKLHNRGMHTPGVIESVDDELRVVPAGVSEDGRPRVRVMSGAALDSNGNDIYLAQPRDVSLETSILTGSDQSHTVYIAIKYSDRPTDYVENVEAPQYSGHTRTTESPTIDVIDYEPNNTTSLELARIKLQLGVTEIQEPVNPQDPQGNEIDRTHVISAGSVGTAERELPSDQIAGLATLMQDTRGDFAQLDRSFPVFSAVDVRSAAVTLEMLTRAGYLRPSQLASVFSIIASLEQDVSREIEQNYPVLVPTNEYQRYSTAVDALWQALNNNLDLGTLINRQGEVSEAAEELSRVNVDPPEAGAAVVGDDTITASNGEATATLDASGSRAFGGRQISSYQWSVGT